MVLKVDVMNISNSSYKNKDKKIGYVKIEQFCCHIGCIYTFSIYDIFLESQMCLK